MLAQLWEQILAISPFEWLGMVTGFIGIWLSIKERVAAWPAFIVCYACYIYISVQYQLHAFTALNAVFIVISAYGWIHWSRSSASTQSEAQKPTLTTKRALYAILVICLLSALTLSQILLSTDGAQFPYWDALACSLALVAQWLLSRKKAETWLFWILSDLIYVGIFFHNQAWPSVILFTGFIVLAIKGWKDWNHQITDNNTSAASSI